MRDLRLKVVAALMAAAALAACGGGGGGDPVAGSPSPAPVPAPTPGPGAPPPPPPPASPQGPENRLSAATADVLVSATVVFNDENGNLISVGDTDSERMRTIVSVTAGALRTVDGSGAAIDGDGSPVVTIVGKQEQINFALNGLAYTAPGTPVSVVLRIVTEDDTSPTALTDTDEMTIVVGAAPPPGFRNFQSASIVLGQPDATSGAGGPPNDHNVLAPRGAVAISDAGRIYVPDTGHSRVLVFGATAGTGATAQLVLGQPNPTTGSAVVDQGRHPEATQVAIGGGRMAVAEPFAHRVSLYTTVPTATNDVPVALLGKDTFTATTTDCTASQLNQPHGVAITPDGNDVVVADTGNHRVNVYFGFPTTLPAPGMDMYLGQNSAAGLACRPNAGEAEASSGTLNRPTGVWTDGVRIVVADTGNNRVLIWNSFRDSGRPNPSAHLVLGQSDFASALPNRGFSFATSTRLNAPTHVASDGTRLAVADTGNHRVLIWNTFPTFNGQGANIVLGQNSFTRSSPNDADQNGTAGAPSAEVFSSPTGLFFKDGKLYVSDRDNNRILVFEEQ